MEISEKLKILGESAKYDICVSSSCRTSGNVKIDSLNQKTLRKGNINLGGVCHSYTPDGRCVSLFKVLLSNICEKNCLYCPNRRDLDFKRVSFKKNELAKLFMDLYLGNFVEGLFLSSAIFCSADKSMSEMLDVCHILRHKYKYFGYIHLKILPGVEDEMVSQAMKIATRVSINFEAPTAEHLKKIAPEKNFHDEIVSKMKVVKMNIDRGNRPNAGVTTQFIVGAAKESDLDIIRTTAYLYKKYSLRRAYFSAFVPVKNTPLEAGKSVPLKREHRLYQADWLMRFYNFSYKELPFNKNGDLPQNVDPKMAWASLNPQYFPVEVNTATKEELMRVPGIGERSALRILSYRRESIIKDKESLRYMGVVTKRALDFVLINGKKHRYDSFSDGSRQLLLFEF